MKLKILSFTGKTFLTDRLISLNLNTKAWEITVLSNHKPLVTAIKPGIARVKYHDANNAVVDDNFAIWWGILEISNNEVKIMADMLIDTHEVNIDKAQKAKAKALELMAKYKDSKDKVDMEAFIEAEDMLIKSMAQLKLWEFVK